MTRRWSLEPLVPLIGVAGLLALWYLARAKTKEDLARPREILEWVAFAVELQDALSTTIRLDAIEIEGKT